MPTSGACPITAHAHGPAGIADAVAAGVDGVEHATFVTAGGVELDERTVDRMAVAGTAVGATEAWLPDGPPLPAVAAGRLEQCWANFARMHRAGVRVVCCSDAGIGPRKPHDVLSPESRCVRSAWACSQRRHRRHRALV